MAGEISPGSASAGTACQQFQQAQREEEGARQTFEAAKAADAKTPASSPEKAERGKDVGKAFEDLMAAKNKSGEMFSKMTFGAIDACGPAPLTPPGQGARGVNTGGNRPFGPTGRS